MIKYFIEQKLFIIKDMEKITDCNRMTLSNWIFITNRFFSEAQHVKFLSHNFRNRPKLKRQHQTSVFTQKLSINHFNQA